MQLIKQLSPNFDTRDGTKVDMLVLHYTGMPTEKAALERMCDAASKVSAHYMVNEEGEIYQLVDESYRAWHAGVSFWRGQTNINARSIGIEIVNPGHEFGYRPFPKKQMRGVHQLCKAILSRHAIPARNVVAHSDIAPERKEDPGELFDWAWLARQGVGLWPELDSGLSRTIGQAPDPGCQLTEFGYNYPSRDEQNERTFKIIKAFQRRFRPSNISGQWDSECTGIISSLLRLIERS